MKYYQKILLTIIILLFVQLGLAAFEPHFMYDPAISNSGETVSFIYLNDIWTVPASGGMAHRLTDTEGTEADCRYSPNDKYLAYNSDKDKYSGIYFIPAVGGEAKLISAEGFSFVDWFSDNKHILASKHVYGIGTQFYKLDLDGNYEIVCKWGGEFGDLSPDDQKIVFCRKGLPFREKYHGSTDGDLWEYDIKNDEYRLLTDNDFTERYPIYSANGEQIYFSAAVEDKFQIFQAPIADLTQRKQLTKFKTWSSRDLSISSDNKIVYEFFDNFQIYDANTGGAQDLKIDIAQDIFTSSEKRENVKNKLETFAISDDAKLLVFSYKYDLFAAPMAGGEVKQITSEPMIVEDIVILNDNRTVIYSGFKDNTFKLFKFDIRNPEKIEEINWSKDKYITDLIRIDDEVSIQYSNNDRRGMLAFADSLGKKITDYKSDEFIWADPAISPDKKYFAYSDRQQGVWNSRIFMVNQETQQKDMIYFSISDIYRVYFGLDNRSLFFSSSGDIHRMDLQAREDFSFEEDNWQNILEDDPKDEDKPESLQYDKEGIAQRVEKIIDRKGWDYIQYVKDDSTFYYSNSYDDEATLWHSNYQGENQEKIYTFKGEPDYMTYNEAEDSFYYILKGRLKKLNLKSKKAENLRFEFDYTYDEDKLNKIVFDRVWCEFGRGFYDPNMQGMDWDKIYKKYAKYLQDTSSLRHLNSIVEEMIGEVNASHTGFYTRKEDKFKTYSSARLGVEFNFENLPRKGLRVKKIYRKSKLLKPFGIKPGDILLSIDDQLVGNKFNSLLLNKIGKKIKLVFQTADGEKEVITKGLTSSQNYKLYYDNWVWERQQKVDELSDGKIGYLHIQSMNWSSYQKFEQDLFTANYDKEALIIDVRNNGGGNTHDYLVEALTKRVYAINSHRGYDASKYAGPARSWEKPMVLLINQDSFSDAEIFPNLFREMGLGKIIGMPTSGSVIGTTQYDFRDGSSMRMPGHGWYRMDGVNMEGTGAKPDIYIDLTPKQKIADDDVQLQKAVEELFKELR